MLQSSWCQPIGAPTVCAGFCVLAFVVLPGRADAAFEGVFPLAVKGEFGGWVTALPDGRLMTWWTKDKPGSKDASGTVQQAFARYSSDNGVTWSEPRLLFDFPRSEGNARYRRDATGIVLCDRDGGVHLFNFEPLCVCTAPVRRVQCTQVSRGSIPGF